MVRRPWSAAAVLLAASGGAVAQDSVSRNANGGNGLPGDAIVPWATTYGRVSYTLDLAPMEGSWGTPLGIGPILKSSRFNNLKFTAINLAPSISATTRTATTYPAATFTHWTAAGGGIHTTENNTSLNSVLSPAGPASRFGVAVLDVDETIAGSTVFFANVLHGAQVAFDPAEPGRLYVTRVVAAHNAPAATQVDRSQFGLGSIDADGNLLFRADSFGSAGVATALLQGDNFFRVKLPLRATSANLIDSAGAANAAATDWLVQGHAVTHAVPNALPADLAGRSVLLAADFTGLFRAETSVNVTTTSSAHRPGTLDHRGSPALAPRVIFPGSIAAAATLTRSTAGAKPDSISVVGLDANGVVTSAATLTLPPAISDACDAFVWPIAGGTFRGYDSQTTFRGGVGPVAIGRDAQGRGLVAGVVYAGATPNPATGVNAIAVARFNPSNPAGTAQWTLAAWADPSTFTGKDLLGDFGADGAPGSNDAGEGDGEVNGHDAPIGRIAGLAESSLGLAGPSLSCPAFDAAGNVYFIASAAMKRWTGTSVVTDVDVALCRSVYDPGSFCYRIERLLRVGDVVAGLNSARSYRIASLSLADSDSVSSGAMFSSGVSGRAWNDLDPATLAPADPQALGGLVVAARIVYDTDQNGLFEDPTLPGGNPASPDEAYNAVLYLGNITAPGPTCDGDVNCDFALDGFDVEVQEKAVGGDTSDYCQPDPDFNGDFALDGFDVEAVELVVGGGPCP